MHSLSRHLITYVCAALNCGRGTTSVVSGLLLAGFAAVTLSGCCGPWWFCGEHHHRY